MISRENDRLILTVELENKAALFQERNPDPFHGGPLFATGFDQIYEELIDQSLNQNLEIVIQMPAAAIEDESENEIRFGLEQRCLHEEATIQRERRALRWEGLKALQNGLVFLVVCLLAAFTLQKTEPFGEFLNFFFEEGLFIVGWVSMWRPVDILLYEWWPMYRSSRMFRRIRTANVRVEARESAWMRSLEGA
jgi:hypothetical protein